MTASRYISDTTLHFCVCDTTYSTDDTTNCHTDVSGGAKAFTSDGDVSGRGADGGGGERCDLRGEADIVGEVTPSLWAHDGLLTARCKHLHFFFLKHHAHTISYQVICCNMTYTSLAIQFNML